MKKFKILYSIVFIALLLFSCGKEKLMVKSKLPVGSDKSLNGQRIDPENMEDEMNSFIAQTLSNELVVYDDYEAQDALLIIEAALNYRTCSPDSDYDEVAVDTLSFNMDLVKEGEGDAAEFIFSHEAMAALWPAILDSVENAGARMHFASPNDPFNIVADLEFSLFEPSEEDETYTAVLQVFTFVAGGGGNNNGCSFNYNATAYSPAWYSCGSSTRMACDYIQAALSPPCYRPNTCAPHDFYSYISHLDLLWDAAHFYSTCPNAPPTCYSYVGYYDSYLWFMPVTSLPYDCMTPTQLSCETNGIKYLGICNIPSTPANQKVISYYSVAGFHAGYPWYHICTVTYGKCTHF